MTGRESAHAIDKARMRDAVWESQMGILDAENASTMKSRILVADR
jgi:hypothetical protein